MSKTMLGVGALLDGVLVVLNQYFNWSGDLNYALGALAIIWGVLILKQN